MIQFIMLRYIESFIKDILLIDMLTRMTRTSILNEYIRVNNGYTIIIYCDIKSDDDVRFYRDIDRLIICIGKERFEYEDEDILTDDTDDEVEELRETFRKIGRYNEAEKVTNRIIGKVDWYLYRYIFGIPIENGFKIKNI